MSGRKPSFKFINYLLLPRAEDFFFPSILKKNSNFTLRRCEREKNLFNLFLKKRKKIFGCWKMREKIFWKFDLKIFRLLTSTTVGTASFTAFPKTGWIDDQKVLLMLTISVGTAPFAALSKTGRKVNKQGFQHSSWRSAPVVQLRVATRVVNLWLGVVVEPICRCRCKVATYNWTQSQSNYIVYFTLKLG